MNFDTSDSCVDTRIVVNFNLLSRAIQGETQRFELIERFILGGEQRPQSRVSSSLSGKLRIFRKVCIFRQSKKWMCLRICIKTKLYSTRQYSPRGGTSISNPGVLIVPFRLKSGSLYLSWCSALKRSTAGAFAAHFKMWQEIMCCFRIGISRRRNFLS